MYGDTNQGGGGENGQKKGIQKDKGEMIKTQGLLRGSEKPNKGDAS